MTPLDAVCMVASVALVLTFYVLPWHHRAFARPRLRWTDRFRRWWTAAGVALGLLLLAAGALPPPAWQTVAAGSLLASCSAYALARAWLDRPKPRRRRVSELVRKLAARIAVPVPAKAGA